MLILYFSGTGNTKYIAELFCQYANAKCHSIEENIDFGQLTAAEETIGFCYPVYGSRVPRIMREFAVKYSEQLKNKKIIIFCTQWIFSGDGARVFTDIFPKKHFEVIYAEHFLMPNNVNNLFFLPLENEKKIEKYLENAERKINLICKNINNGIIKKRGFNIFSVLLGLQQGVFIPLIEKKSLNIVKISGDCDQCRLCVSNCPMNNLELINGKIITKSNCTICYRCINKCPQKAITLYFNKKVKKQYKGVGKSMRIIIAEKNDLPEILNLQKLAFISEAKLHNNFSIQPLKQTIEELKKEYDKHLILKLINANNEIIGSVRTYEEDNVVQISKLIVHPSCQNKGYGTKLLKAVEKYYGNKKYKLFTSSKSEKNIFLYKKNGYTEIKKEIGPDDLEFVFLEKQVLSKMDG